MESGLGGKLVCKTCGLTQMTIPADAGEHTSISCSSCGAHLGKWGQLQNEFLKQTAGADTMDMKHGTIIKNG